MKRLIIFAVAISLLACEKEPKDYVSLEGKVSNGKLDSLTVKGRNFSKTMKISEDGSFKDTMRITDGFHAISNGSREFYLYLKNGYELEVTMDMERFPESISFEGKGAITNEYLKRKIQFIKDEDLANYNKYFELEKDEFDVSIALLQSKMDALLNETKGLEPEVIRMEKDANDRMIIFFQDNYEIEHKALAGLKTGDPSPGFSYPDQNGKNVSLEDLKGKFVYIDVWATWCGPCMKEIPFLKEMDEEYKGKNIAFVSLSIDKMENKDKWLKMIEDEDLRGIQLLADNDWNSDFVTSYNIRGIPRFILLDDQGNILDSNAPRPSDPNLKDILDGLSL
ncbi:TlpA family protein disulfide reductase [Lutimonas saemankumensis]|uniref:TlpA family protein disulfide reductase n=1 Tax=Lutimonas saemankumensis TaxID=483016 RepID=UPI001CD72A05|nr:TlpA disulfide reductase family protein [Lutimonas saemankumensis]MCA0931967.1 TlpA family protein disulfide reductase [Lutimonas saemankumensis]